MCNRDALATAAAGTKSFGGVTYNTVVERMANAMPAGATGVNHGMCIWQNNFKDQYSRVVATGIAVDGTVVLLTVTIQ